MMNLGMALFTGDRLVRLAPVDLVIVVFYFVLVLAIGFYLKGRSNTGEDFFLAGPRNDSVDRRPQLPLRKLGRAGINGLGCRVVSIRNTGCALVLDRRHSRPCCSSAW